VTITIGSLFTIKAQRVMGHEWAPVLVTG